MSTSRVPAGKCRCALCHVVFSPGLGGLHVWMNHAIGEIVAVCLNCAEKHNEHETSA